MYAGLDECSPAENEVLVRLGLRHTGSRELAAGSSSILNWIAQEGISHLAVHFDVDAMRPQSFRRFYSTSLMLERASLSGVPRGRLEPDHVVQLLQDVAGACDIVGLALTEYMSWDAIQTWRLLSRLPLIGP